jgi:pyruvate dehydrogenase E2 component (dihydrolipoamide acetyltransferase)
MIAEFKMPSLGADMEAGTLVEWLVAPGDRVTGGQIVAVVETQKGAIDVEIYQAGTIAELRVAPMTEVPVGTVLATLEVEGEAVSAPEPAPTPQAAAPERVAPTPSSARAKIAPRARKLAADLGVAIDALTPSGPDGSITVEDVQRAAARPAAGGSMREAIAAAMTRANREIPHYHLAHTVDIESALVRLEADNARIPIADRVLPVALFVRAVARALLEHRSFAGWYEEGRFRQSNAINIGLAVARRDGGLVNPALHDADGGTLAELMARIRDLTRRARTGALRASELGDVAITVTSLGDRGVDVVHPIIHPPQVAIIGIGTIARRAWVVGDRVEPRRVVTITLAADHRVTDGHQGARFLQRIAAAVADPEPT